MDPDSFAADPNQLNRDDDEPMFGGRRPSEPFEPSTDDHFYALLNVPKNATDEQIQRSYRSLAGEYPSNVGDGVGCRVIGDDGDV